ncbi:pyridine nucleotide-disulfide oxidoreductase [Rhodococcus sp. NPDC059968]|uniref:pyridine nucleotide-disulfide oxidoreductase n=1 Tax=Rhodococcus sp. NPDC059968 TaxID=3347017 RepID=UPI00366C0FD1
METPDMSDKRDPMRVAVIGAGPSGIFAVGDLLRSGQVDAVDVYDKLPAPYGLVRYGVAPDHLKIKSVSQKFHKILSDERVRFFGNVEYGVDITRADLDAMYHTTIVSAGCPGNRKLDLPGEELRGSIAASSFVSWYNGHPDAPEALEMRHGAVAVIGAGNVSLDIARIIMKGASGLADTDIPPHVLRILDITEIHTVHIVARRGLKDAKFSFAELLEFDSLPGVNIVVDEKDLPSDNSEDLPPASQMTLDLFRKWARTNPEGAGRRIHFHFGYQPTAIRGTRAVEALDLRGTDTGTVNPADELNTVSLAVSMVIRSVGFRGLPLADLPFDRESATIPHTQGRIVEPNSLTDRLPWYVTGWLKRGPQGIIGTNKVCANETVRTLLSDQGEKEDLPALHSPQPEAIYDVLTTRNVQWVSWDAWDRIDAREVELGQASGRPRVKLNRREHLLEAARP